jgi:formate-dependent nitrite reductase cytochrome c552 subunit
VSQVGQKTQSVISPRRTQPQTELKNIPEHDIIKPLSMFSYTSQKQTIQENDTIKAQEDEISRLQNDLMSMRETIYRHQGNTDNQTKTLNTLTNENIRLSKLVESNTEDALKMTADFAEVKEQLKLTRINMDFAEGISKADKRNKQQLQNTLDFLTTENSRLTKLTEIKGDEITKITAELEQIKHQTLAEKINERLLTSTIPNKWHVSDVLKIFYKMVGKQKRYFADIV